MPARLFVEPIAEEPDRARLDTTQTQHLRALRLTTGSQFNAIVGPRRERVATIERVEKGGAFVRLGDDLPDAGRDPASPCVLALALADLARMDFVVEKATELGATAIQVFRAARSQIGDVPASRQARWRRIARSACEQCGRTTLPDISAGLGLAELCRDLPSSSHRVAFSPEATTRWQGAPGNTHGLVLILGPEGGFTREEMLLLESHGVQSASLGPRVLRFETAAIAALALASSI